MTRHLLLVFTLAACGPRAAPQTLPQKPAQGDAWSKLSFEDRHRVMTFTVLPNMARAWRDFKHTQDPEMTCRTCHGPNAEAVDYRMPNPSLTPIDEARVPPGPVAQFMKAKMVPEMRELTGSPSLACNACHTIPVAK